MGLDKYHAKRRFNETPEPEGAVKPSKGALLFVVQKHAASHLHYDFRLEWDGVLKSWAVPKGPSLNPKDKHLAMAVEDHPMDYRTFEGIIPEGNYGAGEVIVWDEGTYYVNKDWTQKQNEQAMQGGLEAGKLVFTMLGHKLKGEFTLVKMHGREENAWLLMKHKDEFVSTEDITFQDQSVITRDTLQDIAAHKGEADQWKSGKKAAGSKNGKLKEIDLPKQAKKAAMPHEIKPMLATLVDTPFDREGWLFEIKWDGYRAVAEVNAGEVSLYSRNFKSFNTKFAPITKALKALPDAMILDGEIVALGEDGLPNFSLLQDAEQHPEKLVYMVFDLVYYRGHDLRQVPLTERKALLQTVLPPDLALIRFCDHVEQTGEAFFKAVQKQGLEGMIAKDGQGTYVTGSRTASWLKIKTHLRQEVIICGYTRPRGSRKNIGALILGLFENGELRYAGHTGTGMGQDILASLQARLDALAVEKCPFAKKPKTNAPAQWVQPELVCEIKFQEWTPDGLMRQPVFMGLREDKAASQVLQETPEPADAMVKAEEKATHPEETPKVRKPSTKTAKKTASQASSFKDKVTQTHRDKIYYPELKLTKGDLLDYYEAIAPTILPYLKDRPMSLNRYPNGITGKSFYQKDNPPDLPDYIETVDVDSDSHGGPIHYILCQNAKTLLYLANLGCIEMNPWNSRVPKLEYPDYIVIDLDPGDISFEAVIEAAQVTHDILDHAGAAAYCKTSGATGLHIYVPLDAQYDYETGKNFANLVVELLREQLPKTTTLERSLSKRPKQSIYLDYLQNRRGQTLASVFSARPKPAASVSTPLTWNEVVPGLDPKQFTIQNIRDELAERDKLWQPVLKTKVNLQACMKRLSS